jgi:hypothetical protein
LKKILKEEWKNGRMEEWKNGRIKEWKNGRMEEGLRDILKHSERPFHLFYIPLRL